jgi:phosphatidylglycerophosphate synthase
MGTSLLERWNKGLVRPLERSALAWLAARMPPWVTPDRLTSLGVVGAIVTCFGYAWSRSHPGLLWIATFGLAINWFGDSLDGTLARFRNIERPRYGYYLDNAIDCLLALPVAIAIGLSGYVRFDVCFLALSTYTMISALTFLRANVTGVFQISYAGLGPTEVRIALAVVNTLIFIFPPTSFDLFGVTFKYPDLTAIMWSSATVVTYLVCMTTQTRQLASEEPAQRSEPFTARAAATTAKS